MIVTTLIPTYTSAAEPVPVTNCNEDFRRRNTIAGYDPCSVVPTVCTGDSSGVGSAISGNIPPEWQDVFTRSASKFGTNPNFLAALYLSENGNVWHPVTRTNWPTNAVSKAAGPMQFVPGTWLIYKTDGDNDGDMDINDVDDAVFAAGKLSKALQATPTTPLGNITSPLQKPSLLRSAASYNWGDGNVAGAGTSASLSSLPDETAKYVNNVYSLFQSNFTKSGNPNYPDPKASVGTTGTDSTTLSSVVSCATDSGGTASVDGLTFPLRTTQQVIKDMEPYPWCFTKQVNCHHDYNAADIFAPTGTPVLAAKSGKVVSAKDSTVFPSKVGSRITIKADDGTLWYYAHMGRGTVKVSNGQTVVAGQIIGAVGTNTDAEGTPKHLHIDSLPSSYDFRPGCSSGACTSYPFIDIQPSLVKSFGALPPG